MRRTRLVPLVVLALVALDAPQASSVTLTASALLAKLPVKAESNAGYDRSLFRHWIDADGDGCDTRAEVLMAESLVATTRNSSCTVQTGKWVSFVDGRTWTSASDLEIDHLVALSEAWGSGARSWSPLQRQRYANDLGFAWSLNAITSSVNSAKSDYDPAQWLPPKVGVRCLYAIRWMEVKYRWRLSIDATEKTALQRLLSGTCGQKVITLPALAPKDTGTTVSSTSGNCDPAYPTVCIPPPPPDLDCSDVPYRNFTVLPPDPHHFDGNGDGIGCSG